MIVKISARFYSKYHLTNSKRKGKLLMLKLYGFDLSTPVNKVKYTLNFLHIPYEYISINPQKGELQLPEHLGRHPAGKVPVIDDKGFILFESNSIIRYLAQKENNNQLYPSDLKSQAIVNQWIDFSSNHIGKNMSRIIFNRFFAKKVGVAVDTRAMEEGESFLLKYLPILEAQLKSNIYLLGNEITLADIALVAHIDPIEIVGIDLDIYPNLSRWFNQIRSQKFYSQVHHYYAEGMIEKEIA